VRGYVHKVEYIDIPNLDQLMRERHATNEALATAAGVSTKTVDRARARGHRIRKYLADCLLETLETRTFRYLKRGPKPGEGRT
jgi:hypothetical protein